jgi:hypothetical protein
MFKVEHIQSPEVAPMRMDHWVTYTISYTFVYIMTVHNMEVHILTVQILTVHPDFDRNLCLYIISSSQLLTENRVCSNRVDSGGLRGTFTIGITLTHDPFKALSYARTRRLSYRATNY